MSGIKLSFETVGAAPAVTLARITLARPPLNVLDIATIRELSAAIEEAERHTAVQALLLAAEGEKAFSVGVDVKDHTPERVPEMLNAFHCVFRMLARTARITIAAVRGFCLGGGCELATFADLVVAADDAQFGQPEIQLACFPPIAAITFPRLVGEKKAAELLWTGKRIGAAEAARLGLVNRVAPVADLDKAVQELLGELFHNSGAALRLAKRAIRLDFAPEFERRMAALERLYLDELMRTYDAEEGIRAFLEKRQPAWKHS